MNSFTPTPRTRVVRHAERGVYDREQIYSILDEAFICHVGFVADGQPYVIPTAYGRADDRLYLHGAAANRMLRSLAQGVDICATVTLIDGFVMARAAFRQSFNYRSVVILGKARLITDPAEKTAALRCLTNHVVAGRWEEVRPPDEKELAATSVLELPITEASAKVRSGPPLDAEADWPRPVWAGVVPVELATGEPVPDTHLLPGIPDLNLDRFGR
ncbi:MAG: pyridoxamine 5'-phosphate oxidase family protein [Bryobacterales bacterium]|nr:pyridoxamine 5'-phosphate oxidase family protein [Bryobacterales bacterium]MBV9400386.1 pyridoxamine 5'-phosphate oxidase family protein [Bryobacterales bacterium]